MIGAAKGYKVKLFLPENASPERKLILRAFGAELVLTSPLEGTDGAIRAVRQLVAEHPERYFYPDQYSNDANWRAHFDTTGPEIIEQTGGRVTHFVAGLGTSGTFMGTSRRLAAVQSEHQGDVVPARLAVPRARGAEAHGNGDGARRSTTPSLADADVRVSTEEAHRCVRRLAREAGLMVGHIGRRRAGGDAAVLRARSIAASSSRCFPTARRSTSPKASGQPSDDDSRDPCSAGYRRGGGDSPPR